MSARRPFVPFVFAGIGLLSASVALTGSQTEETDAPLPAEEAARTMVVPEGFKVTVFAAEPNVRQPIGFCIDDRGRLWVAEAYNYPNHGTRPGDRIVILEDTDGDGRFDNRTVFYDKLNYVTGIEVGFGGAWVMSPPHFYFIPDRDGDDVPDADPEVLLDGFGNHANAHNLANGFAWGPDGWLYGTHGRTNWSSIGTPGTPDSDRVRFDGGVYRYHPVTRKWEPFADGTTNPWGIDWNDVGDAFVCNCVNPHLFHVIQGAHYEPWRNRESSRYAYKRIDTIADHLHFVGTHNVRDGLGSAEEDAAGGGHAHCGTMVYLGDNWPERYRNHVFLNNIHGRRINNDLLRTHGSGYSASHGADLMVSRDPWHMGVTLAYGPDGSVFVSDWSDTGECHSVRNTRRQTGRIYRISYGDPPYRRVNIPTLASDDLVQLQLHRNDWFVRHARRVLQERAAAGQNMTGVREQLHRMFAEHPDVTRKLRALWALHCVDGLSESFLTELLEHESPHVRGWAIRLLHESGAPSRQALERCVTLAERGESPAVRLQLACALQRLPHERRWPLARALMQRGEDADDPNLPLMIWYGTEPLHGADSARFASLLESARMPLVRQHIARRIASAGDDDSGLSAVLTQLRPADSAARGDIVQGLLTGLEGRRSVAMPERWPSLWKELDSDKDASVRAAAVRLSLVFRDPAAMKTLRSLAADTSRSATERDQALEALLARRVSDLPPLLLELVDDPAVRNTALRGLAEYSHPRTATVILAAWPNLDSAARGHAVQTLASRSAWSTRLLDAIEEGTITRTELTAYTARQLRNLGDPDVIDRVRSLWGNVRPSGPERARQIDQLRGRLTPRNLARANPAEGRVVFDKLCANCHRLFDAGGTIGPDLTGSQRTHIDYLLENLVDPNSAVSKDYQMETITTAAGRVVTGLVVAENDNAITVATLNERVVIPRDEIDERRQSDLSMMPEGLLQTLSPTEVRDLFGYLQSSQQVAPAARHEH